MELRVNTKRMWFFVLLWCLVSTAIIGGYFFTISDDVPTIVTCALFWGVVVALAVFVGFYACRMEFVEPRRAWLDGDRVVFDTGDEWCYVWNGRARRYWRIDYTSSTVQDNDATWVYSWTSDGWTRRIRCCIAVAGTTSPQDWISRRNFHSQHGGLHNFLVKGLSELNLGKPASFEEARRQVEIGANEVMEQAIEKGAKGLKLGVTLI